MRKFMGFFFNGNLKISKWAFKFYSLLFKSVCVYFCFAYVWVGFFGLYNRNVQISDHAKTINYEN